MRKKQTPAWDTPKVDVDPEALAYYMSLPYKVVLTPIPKEDGEGWYVEIPELPGCQSDGKTPDEAVAMIEDAKRGWLISMLHRHQVKEKCEPRAEKQQVALFVSGRDSG
jgi:predicted RNase H-like HicB family nuclease